MKKFWNWIHDDSGGRVLRLEGPIDEDDFWGDSVTPKMFRDELYTDEGDITLWINSPGGNVFCAAEIYTMLRDYPGSVTVRIASIAASAASVVAMAGNLVQISPTGMLMVHDPSTIAMGNARDMEKAITTLNEVKESIINAYAFKTGLSRNRISKLMSDETWLNAKKAVELGFADEILFEAKKQEPEEDPDEPDKENDPDTEEGGDEGEEGGEKKKPFKLAEAMWQYSSRVMGETILNRLGAENAAESTEPEQETGPETQEPIEGVEADTDTDLTEDAPAAPVETDTEPARDNDPDDTEPDMPVIGLNGKTKDGAMPYEILKDKLEWMR
ncbi:MAG: ATP-dependent Clp protease proteolytic subunit [Mogibacterium sp.]|nr:ATP-dependent Clp protease proteolytic subunit [Mogibacterium sp.]